MIHIKQPLTIDQKTLIPEVNFTIEPNEHIAFIGSNGIGKTTLLELLCRQYDGTMLTQSVHSDELVLSYILRAKPELHAIKQRMTDDMNAIGDYIEHDGYIVEQQIVTQLQKFGMDESLLDRSIHTLSGGEQTKAGLARMLLEEKSLLIFDEPTNHIDSETKKWLIEWMNQSDNTIIYASHDRDFINQTATKIVELTKDGARTFHTNYDGYQAQKEIEIQTNTARVEKERKEKQRIKQQIQSYKEWHHEANTKASVRDPKEQKKVAKIAKRFKQTEHKLEQQISNFEGKVEKQARTDYSLHTTNISVNNFIRFEHVSFGYDTELLNDINFTIKKGDKIRLYGPNGSGKSTILKLMTGDLKPTKGIITINPNVHMGYFSQQLEVLNSKNTVLNEILSLETMTLSEARTILASFRFTAERMDDTVAQLSMGEQCRLAFVKLYFSHANLLVLDEPTNYFDIEMQEIIERMLLNYEGTIIFVSHDAYFSTSVANRYFKLEQGKLTDSEITIDQELDQQLLQQEINDYLELDYNPFEK